MTLQGDRVYSKQTNLKKIFFSNFEMQGRNIKCYFIESADRVALLTPVKTLSHKGGGACCREELLVHPGHLASLSLK